MYVAVNPLITEVQREELDSNQMKIQSLATKGITILLAVDMQREGTISSGYQILLVESIYLY